MILCAAQMTPSWGDPDTAFTRIHENAARAVECDAALIAFPEQVVTGWDPHDGDSWVQALDGDIVSRFRETARDLSIGILGSLREHTGAGPRNTAIVIGPSGNILATYAKMHLFSPGGEQERYIPGDRPALFQLEGCRCGIAICYDLRFSSLFRVYRDAGADLMLVPSAWPASRMRFFELFTTARAVEYQYYLAGINTVGTTPVDTYSGGSRIIGPDGTVLNQAGSDEELLFCDIQPDQVEEVRRSFPVKRDERDDIR